MKSANEWETILNELYWNVEHGEQQMAIKKLQQFELDAYKQAFTDMAGLCISHTQKGGRVSE